MDEHCSLLVPTLEDGVCRLMEIHSYESPVDALRWREILQGVHSGAVLVVEYVGGEDKEFL